jgi:hypothetical protein
VLPDHRGFASNGTKNWDSAFLPAQHQGTIIYPGQERPIADLFPGKPAGYVSKASEAAAHELLARLDRQHAAARPGDGRLDARIRSYELAARMQLAAVAALDVSRETAATRRLYGLDNPLTADYGARCLMARRLVEAGVRFVQVSPPLEGNQWDHHSGIKEALKKICAKTDQPAAALIKDLKSRGLLDSTIVMWTGEFGRLPTTENADGRDHNRHALSLFLAGGGFKNGHVHGATDDFSYKAVVDRVSVPDLHATFLQQLGLDHRRLWYRHHGRRETLTDAPVTGARLVREILQLPPRA